MIALDTAPRPCDDCIMTNSIDAQTLADAILASDYFNDATIDYPPFASDPAPAMRTLADLADYAQCHIDNLRPALIAALDDDLRDLIHNSNFDAIIPTSINIDDDARTDFIHPDLIADLINNSDELYDLLADKLIARAS